MIVFYVVPYKEINDNKKKYSDYYFEKPYIGIVVSHFLLHVILIALGCFIISGAYNDFYQTSLFLEILIPLLCVFATIYIVECVFSGVFIKMITKEDYLLSQITEPLNSSHPINNFFFFFQGEKKGSKGKHYTCYSERGIALPVKSDLKPPNFNPNDYKADFFFLKITQKVDMSDQLILWVGKVKTKISSCGSKYSADYNFYPFYEGKKLILSDGKKIPSKFKKPNTIASLIFGLGMYPEILVKSIPIKNFEQNSFVDVDTDSNYSSLIESIDCSYLGSCKVANNPPKM